MMRTTATLFSGFEGVGVGARNAGLTHLWGVEYDTPIASVAELNGFKTIVADVRSIDYAALERPWHLHASPVCFPEGTLVVTSRGLIDIKDILIGDMVITHKGRYMPVIDTCSRQSKTVKLMGLGHPGLIATPDHPIYAMTAKREYESHKKAKSEGRSSRTAKNEFSEPAWVEASIMPGKHWLSLSNYPFLSIPEIEFRGNESLQGQRFKFDESFFRIIGVWVGDGWVRYSDGKGNKKNRGQVSICCSHAQTDTLKHHLECAGFAFSATSRRTTTEFCISSRPLCRWLTDNFGAGAENKTIPAWLLGIDKKLRQSFIDGYCFADGWVGSRRDGNRRFNQIRTISKKLALGTKLIANSLGYTASWHSVNVSPTTVIEGRTVNQKPAHMVRFSASDRLSKCISGYRTGLVRTCVDESESQTVYCITVDEDNSFVADGIIVHNCKNASVAKADGEESAEDIATAAAVERAIETLRPALFTLENVRGYLHFAAFKNIVATLKRLGYAVTHSVLNSANFGVPQTRERLILVARNDGRKPRLPVATHARADKLGTLFDERKAWVGWYEAIEDLIPALPDAVFAPWQLKRLPDELRESVILAEGGYDGTVVNRAIGEPVFAITANQNQQHLKAWLVGSENAGQEWGGTRWGDEPAIMLSTKQSPRAFIVNTNQSGNDGDMVQVRNEDEPMFTTTISAEGRLKAFIVDGQPAYGSDDTATRADGEPVFTIGATQDRRPLRAYLVGGANTSETQAADGVGVSSVNEPTRCVNASNSNSWRGSVNGRVVKMTPRCLARFQSFPDSYVLPSSAKLATTGIGNAVPPLLMQRVLEANL